MSVIKETEEIYDKKFEFQGQTYSGFGTAYWSIDDAYGQDADGNRGTTRRILDDLEVEYILDEDENEILLTDEIKLALTDAVKEGV